MIAALTAEWEAGGRRPLLMFDSTSPPEALARFRDMHDRRRAEVLTTRTAFGPVSRGFDGLCGCWHWRSVGAQRAVIGHAVPPTAPP